MIPVQNIYYMLSYAFQALQVQNYKDLATEEFHNTREASARCLPVQIQMLENENLHNQRHFLLFIVFYKLYSSGNKLGMLSSVSKNLKKI